MPRHLVSLSLSLAVGCSDDSSSDMGEGGTQSASNGGTQNSSSAGTAGSSSAAAGSGGSSNGASGAGGDSAGGASGTGGLAGASSSGNPTVEDVCQRGCVKTESLNCPNDPANCEASCLTDYLDFPAECRALVLTLGDCAADRAASDFLCDEEGESILRAGICGAESIAVASCLFDAL
jgi:hypothetical protein